LIIRYFLAQEAAVGFGGEYAGQLKSDPAIRLQRRLNWQVHVPDQDIVAIY